MSLDCGLKRVEEFKKEWECYDTTGTVKENEKLAKGVYIGMVRSKYPNEDVTFYLYGAELTNLGRSIHHK